MKVFLRNDAGVTKECKVGFSWTMFFFGLFVPLLRGDFKWTILSAVLSIITCGIAWLVLPFIYNKKYIVGLLEKGYKPATENDENILASKGIIQKQFI